MIPHSGPAVVGALSTADIISLAGTAVQTVLIATGLVLVAVQRRRRGLQALLAGLFVALMFTMLMEFGKEQFTALVTFLVVAV